MSSFLPGLASWLKESSSNPLSEIEHCQQPNSLAFGKWVSQWWNGNLDRVTAAPPKYSLEMISKHAFSPKGLQNLAWVNQSVHVFTWWDQMNLINADLTYMYRLEYEVRGIKIMHIHRVGITTEVLRKCEGKLNYRNLDRLTWHQSIMLLF